MPTLGQISLIWHNKLAQQIVVERLSSLLYHEDPNNKTCQFRHYHIYGASCNSPKAMRIHETNTRQRSPTPCDDVAEHWKHSVPLSSDGFWQVVDPIIFPPIASKFFRPRNHLGPTILCLQHFSSHQLLPLGVG